MIRQDQAVAHSKESWCLVVLISRWPVLGHWGGGVTWHPPIMTISIWSWPLDNDNHSAHQGFKLRQRLVIAADSKIQLVFSQQALEHLRRHAPEHLLEVDFARKDKSGSFANIFISLITHVMLWFPCLFLWWIEAQPRPAFLSSKLKWFDLSALSPFYRSSVGSNCAQYCLSGDSLQKIQNTVKTQQIQNSLGVFFKSLHFNDCPAFREPKMITWLH